MKFLVDAQLPKRLAARLQAANHDALHTLDLPQQNWTRDSVINRISVEQERIVITKDSDFRDSYFIQGKPYKLLLISTGNIKNNDLIALLEQNLDRIVEAFQTYSYVEIGRNYLTIHQ